MLKKYTLLDVHSDEGCSVLHTAFSTTEKRLPFKL